MSKSRIAPNTYTFQLEVLDFKHRQSPPPKGFYVDKSGKGIKEIFDHIPRITLFRRTKTHKQAIKSASKKGTVISCRKVNSQYYRLNMIDYLRVEPKPVEVDISPDEFILGRDLEIEPTVKTKKIEINRNEAIDK